jgi:hypothetical protein
MVNPGVKQGWLELLRLRAQWILLLLQNLTCVGLLCVYWVLSLHTVIPYQHLLQSNRGCLDALGTLGLISNDQ